MSSSDAPSGTTAAKALSRSAAGISPTRTTVTGSATMPAATKPSPGTEFRVTMAPFEDREAYAAVLDRHPNRQRVTRRQARRPAHDHLGHVPPRSSQRLPPRTSPPEPLHLRGVGRVAQVLGRRISQPVVPRHQTGRSTERHRPPQIGETRLPSLRRRSARAGSHRTPVTGRGPRFEAPRSEARSRTRLSSHLPPRRLRERRATVDPRRPERPLAAAVRGTPTVALVSHIDNTAQNADPRSIVLYGRSVGQAALGAGNLYRPSASHRSAVGGSLFGRTWVGGLVDMA
jgi:hypothetical protein